MFLVGHVGAITVSLEMGPAVAAQAAVKRDGAAGWRFIAGVRCLGHVTGPVPPGTAWRGGARELWKQLCRGGKTDLEKICCLTGFMGFLSWAAAN